MTSERMQGDEITAGHRASAAMRLREIAAILETPVERFFDPLPFDDEDSARPTRAQEDEPPPRENQ